MTSHAKSRRRRLRGSAAAVGLAASALAPLLLPHPAIADETWNNAVVSGSWSVPSNWSGNAVPGPADNAILLANDSTSRTVTLDVSSTVLSFQLGNSGTGSFTLSQPVAANLTASSGFEYLGAGSGGHASHIQSAGTNTIASALYVGASTASTATYSLSGTGAIDVTGAGTGAHGLLIGGYSGVGSFNQSGGSVSLGSTSTEVDLNVGYNFGSSASYTLSGGTLSSGGEIISLYGNASFAQTGGTNSALYDLDIGSTAGSTGTYSLSGTGTLNARLLVLGWGGTGNYVQSGGTAHFAGNLYAGFSSGSTTSCLISGGSITFPFNAFVGGNYSSAAGAGTLAISGGSVSVTDTLKVYNTTSATATLSGGSLSVGALDLGGNPSHFAWTGGTLNFSNGYTLDSNFPLTANVTLASGMTLASSAAATNSGSITLGGGALSGSGALTNSPAGTIAGYGTISPATFTNGGTLLLESAGLLNVTPASYSNTGVVQLANLAATLGGGTLSNNGGMVQGFGKISAAIINASGTIEATGGTLTLAGPVTNPGGGILRAAAGNELLLTNSSGNNGSIVLTGGTFDTAGHSFGNGGSLSGYGTVSTGGGTLTNNSQIQLSGGPSSFSGPVVSAAGSKIIVSGGSTATFYSPVSVNSGAEFRVSAGSSAVFFAAVSGAGNFSGTGSKYFEGGASEPGFLATGGSTSVDAGASLTTAYLREASLTNSSAIALLPSTQGGQASSIGALTLLPGSTFDLADNRLTTSTSADTVRSYLQAGLLFGSPAFQVPPNVYGTGYLTSGGSTVVQFALIGDANMDGVINADDYALVDRAFARSLSDAHWQDGDFNYDGVVNSADYLLLDTTYGKMTGQLAESLLAARLAQFGPAYVQALTAAVPEPACAVVLGGALLLLRRRRASSGGR